MVQWTYPRVRQTETEIAQFVGRGVVWKRTAAAASPPPPPPQPPPPSQAPLARLGKRGRDRERERERQTDRQKGSHNLRMLKRKRERERTSLSDPSLSTDDLCLRLLFPTSPTRKSMTPPKPSPLRACVLP